MSSVAPAPAFFDVAIVRAGTTGLFAVLELGLPDLNAVATDRLDKPGVQRAQFYPEKLICGIPCWPVMAGQYLSDRRVGQIVPFAPYLAARPAGNASGLAAQWPFSHAYQCALRLRCRSGFRRGGHLRLRAAPAKTRWAEQLQQPLAVLRSATSPPFAGHDLPINGSGACSGKRRPGCLGPGGDRRRLSRQSYDISRRPARSQPLLRALQNHRPTVGSISANGPSSV